MVLKLPNENRQRESRSTASKSCDHEAGWTTRPQSELKSDLIAALLERHPEAEGDQAEAIVTHWFHNPHVEIPLLSEEMRATLLRARGPLTPRTVDSTADSRHSQLRLLETDVPFPPPPYPEFTFIDLFAGIGGFRLAMQAVGGRCVFSSEWDPDSKRTYEANFGEVPFGDIRRIQEDKIADHDVLCAGFPCQPFSRAGVSARSALNIAHGFDCETQGTLFFDIERIVRAKRPKIVFLENVRNLVTHDGGRTFATIRRTLEQAGYTFSYAVLDASSVVPQRRQRCYIVCVDGDAPLFEFPSLAGPALPLRSILEVDPGPAYTISDRLWNGHIRRTNRNLERGAGFTAFCADLDKPSNTLVARYGKDGKECLIPQREKNPRMLTPRECARLQGFPEAFVLPKSKTTAYRQFGNSVAVPVIDAIAKAIVARLRSDRRNR